MREEYSLDHLISRDVEQADIERMIPNPQKKELVKECSKQLKQLKKKKEHYATKVLVKDIEIGGNVFPSGATITAPWTCAVFKK
jgi:hypothetical protein